jgi:hypothetical protein
MSSSAESIRTLQDTELTKSTNGNSNTLNTLQKEDLGKQRVKKVGDAIRANHQASSQLFHSKPKEAQGSPLKFLKKRKDPVLSSSLRRSDKWMESRFSSSIQRPSTAPVFRKASSLRSGTPHQHRKSLDPTIKTVSIEIVTASPPEPPPFPPPTPPSQLFAQNLSFVKSKELLRACLEGNEAEVVSLLKLEETEPHFCTSFHSSPLHVLFT